jgi:hypothetical protein
LSRSEDGIQSLDMEDERRRAAERPILGGGAAHYFFSPLALALLPVEVCPPASRRASSPSSRFFKPRHRSREIFATRWPRRPPSIAKSKLFRKWWGWRLENSTRDLHIGAHVANNPSVSYNRHTIVSSRIQVRPCLKTLPQVHSIPAWASLWQLRCTPAQDTPKAAVLSDFIYAVQPLIGTPMHTWRLFRKGIKNVLFRSQAR